MAQGAAPPSPLSASKVDSGLDEGVALTRAGGLPCIALYRLADAVGLFLRFTVLLCLKRGVSALGLGFHPQMTIHATQRVIGRSEAGVDLDRLFQLAPRRVEVALPGVNL